MIDLSERQKLILALVIHEYVRTADPVGSRGLVERYHLDMSSATVRHELAELTDHGFLRQPHTSAGRVPTEMGYRYFVGRLLQETTLPDALRRTISHQFYQMSDDVDEWLRLAASVLATQTRSVSLVTYPHAEQAHFKHLELIEARGRQVLMVLVLSGGEIKQRIISLEAAATQVELSDAANHLSQLLIGKTVNGIQTLLSAENGLTDFERNVISWVLGEMEEANATVAGEMYLDGLANVLQEPEFAGTEDGRKAMRLLEERSSLQNLLVNSLPVVGTGGVHVLIGSEGAQLSAAEELRQWSVVLARYGAPGQASGTLGVLGPMRMSYGRTISTVRFISGLLSGLVNEKLID